MFEETSSSWGLYWFLVGASHFRHLCGIAVADATSVPELVEESMSWISGRLARRENVFPDPFKIPTSADATSTAVTRAFNQAFAFEVEPRGFAAATADTRAQAETDAVVSASDEEQPG